MDRSGGRKLQLDGELKAVGKQGWLLHGTLGATTVQPCAITTDPVATRIDTPVTRRYCADYEDPSGTDVEMPEDDTLDPLPTHLAPWSVMVEALDLALPLFPRADGATLAQTQFTEPGLAPMTDDDAKPFAGLADFRDQLKKSGG